MEKGIQDDVDRRVPETKQTVQEAKGQDEDYDGLGEGSHIERGMEVKERGKSRI